MFCQIIVFFAFSIVQIGISLPITAHAQDPVDIKKANPVIFPADILLHKNVVTLCECLDRLF